MGKNKLKPCPFCGGRAFIHEIGEDFLGLGWKQRGYAVVCKECHASTEYDENKNISIQAWNKRAGEDGVGK